MHINEDILWDYADGLLTPAERLEVDAYLRQHPEYQVQLNEVLAFRAQMHATPLEKPRAGFTDRVMAAWATEQMQAYQPPANRDWIVFSVAAAFGLFILSAFVSVVFTVTGSISAPLPLELPSMQLPELGGVFQSRLLQLLLPVALAVMTLLLLDKYLRHRKFLEQLEEA